MALTSSDVYSPQTPGLATVLGSGLGPLRVIQQEAYRHAREAAARAKAQAELEKQFTPPTPDTDGGQIFAPQVAERVKALMERSLQRSKDMVAGKITPNEAKTLTSADLAETNIFTKRAKDSQIAVDKFRDNAKANGIASNKIGDAISMATSDPTTGGTYDANKFDPESLAQLTANSDYLDEPAVTQRILKGLAGKQESDYATAARLGGTGMDNSAASNYFEMQNGKVVYTLDANKQKVPKIANLKALEQAFLQDDQGAALLRGRLQRGQQGTATALMGIAPEHVTDDQLEALNAQTDQNTPHERQSLADLIRPYGTLVQKEKESYLAPRAPRASSSSSAAKIEEDTEGFSEPGTYNATLAAPNVPYALKTEDGPLQISSLPGATKEGFQHFGRGAQPKVKKKDGTYVDVEAKNIQPQGYYQENGKGHFEYVPNNKTPIAGGYGEPYQILVDAKTGRLHDLAPGENADNLVSSGKFAYATHLNLYAHKNENYTADLSTLTEDLLNEKNSNGDPKYQSRARAEIAAKEALEKGRSRKLLPYAENKVFIDRDTRTSKGRGYYQAFDEKVQALNARLQANAPRNPAGSVYQRATTTKSTTAPAKTSGWGSILKSR